MYMSIEPIFIGFTRSKWPISMVFTRKLTLKYKFQDENSKKIANILLNLFYEV